MGGTPWDPRGDGSHGIPWEESWGPCALGIPWALGDLLALWTQALGDPWALGAPAGPQINQPYE